MTFSIVDYNISSDTRQDKNDRNQDGELQYDTLLTQDKIKLNGN